MAKKLSLKASAAEFVPKSVFGTVSAAVKPAAIVIEPHVPAQPPLAAAIPPVVASCGAGQMTAAMWIARLHQLRPLKPPSRPADMAPFDIINTSTGKKIKTKGALRGRRGSSCSEDDELLTLADGKLRGIVKTAAQSYTDEEPVVVVAQTPPVSPARGLSYAEALKVKSQQQQPAPVTIAVTPSDAAPKPPSAPSTPQRNHAEVNLNKLKTAMEELTDDTVGAAVTLLPQNPMTAAHSRPASNKGSNHAVILNAKNTSELLRALVARARSHADATRCCATLLCHIGLRYVVLPCDVLGPDGAPLPSVEIPTFRSLLFRALHAPPSNNAAEIDALTETEESWRNFGTFLGHLYTLHAVNETVTHTLVTSWLERCLEDSSTRQPVLHGVCALLHATGKALDRASASSRAQMDDHFTVLEVFISEDALDCDDHKTSPETQAMLSSLLSLRESDWNVQ